MSHGGAITAIPHELGADQFEIVVRKLADDLTYGTDLSRFVGPGIDYAQTRPFAYGDSVKSIDWRVTARTGKFHIKEYESVKRVGVFVVVDTSASMSIASGLHTHASKHDYAVWIAGAIAIACLRRRSPVCLLSCGERDGQVSPTMSRGQVWRAIETLRNPGREERTNVASALQRVESLSRNTCAVVLISDLHDPTAIPAIRRVGQRHDALVMRVRDPAERLGLGAGFYRGVEAESGREFLGASRGGFGDADADPLAGSGLDHTTIWTDEAIIPKLAQMLATRGGAGRAAR
jgi:uncharacterized protein (DUF58 family)